MSGTVPFIAPHLVDDKLRGERDYWLRTLAGSPAATTIPHDFTPVASPPRRHVLERDLPESARALLVRVCGANDALMFAALLTTLKICLYRFTGQDDLSVGTVIHRRYADLAAVNKWLVLRDRLSGSQTVKELLLAVRQTLMDAFAHQRYPLSRIREQLAREQGGSRELFQVAMVLDGLGDPAHLAGVDTDLTLIVSDREGVLHLRVEYGDGYDPETIDIFLRQYADAIERALRTPDAAIGTFTLLSAEARQRLTVAANRTARGYDRTRRIHDLIAAQAASTPDALALECRGARLTFAELDRQANQLARYLIADGVAPGEAVGLCVEHSLEMVVGILGALYAGAAYVPLDPAHPSARTQFIVRDAGIRRVLTQERLAHRLEAMSSGLILLDAHAPRMAVLDSAPVRVETDASSIAYIIYTSGSTGEPKGVEISHQSLVNYILWASDVYLRGEPLPFALYSSIAFDLTVTSLFTPLVTGNAAIIYPQSGIDHPLIDVLRDNRVGVVKLTPSHLAMVKDRGLRADRVTRVIVGGEAFEMALARTAAAIFAESAEIFNEYGPTEATVGCMIHRVGPSDDRRAFVPIGLPAANARIYILDDHLSPCGEHVLGEIHIAGEGLARGYLNRPGLTRERFIENPWAAGERIYRTGDLARWRAGGAVEYCHRRDDQVKFHGHRVELNEIRLALNAYPGIKDSVVTITAGSNGRDMMAAFYTASDAIDAAALRQFLLTRLVEETIPNVFVPLGEIPLTPNGKIDYHALPAQDAARDQTVARRPPRTQTEELLAGIWAQVLERSDIGVADDFFELGGHSLVAHQIVSRTRATFQIDLPLRTLFDATTIEKLAAIVDGMARQQAGLAVPPIRRMSRTGTLRLSFAQQRLWFMDQLHPGGVTYNICPAFTIHGALNPGALEQSLNEILRRHESLRTSFSMAHGEPCQVICPAATVTLPLRDLSALDDARREEEVRRVIAEEAGRPFSLGEAPLLRAVLVRKAPDEHLVILAIHHIVCDAVSMGIFYRELAAIYGALTGQAPANLEPLPVQYADYAAWQRDWLAGPALDAQVAYWRAKLNGAPSVLDLIPQRSALAAATDRGAFRGVQLSRRVSDGVKALSVRQRCTVFMTLLAGFQLVLRHLAKRDDIVIGADIANRSHPEIEHVIGFFVNTLVLRTDFSGNPAFTDALVRVRDQCLDAFSHQDVPFDKVVEELNPSRDSGRNPIFQVMFGFVQQNSTLAMQLRGLEIRPLAIDTGTSVFDFSLYMADTPQGLGGTARYRTDVYDSELIDHCLRLFEAVLDGVSTHPHMTLREIDALLDGIDRREREGKARELREGRGEAFRRLTTKPQSAAAG